MWDGSPGPASQPASRAHQLAFARYNASRSRASQRSTIGDRIGGPAVGLVQPPRRFCSHRYRVRRRYVETGPQPVNPQVDGTRFFGGEFADGSPEPMGSSYGFRNLEASRTAAVGGMVDKATFAIQQLVEHLIHVEALNIVHPVPPIRG
jgi:hypothetical protein